ncbi:MAG: hypothetical protein A3K19_17755 [Lentisphaerae bacterium RIFOXYB12_FULL_65_16]|nr:MAG: hypothetical protein A3K18_19085 [Lentisphaerae bacterium RIFOXYA12_64_32]OGV85285.1 MAG: hypothetical protein A3K19_17755 [Lentisphaerae bacterium RIFOXYB12_FULL_65_16]
MPLFARRMVLALSVVVAVTALAIPEPPPARTVLTTGFEPGQPVPAASQHQVVSDHGHASAGSLTGEVTEPDKACALQVPFEGKAGEVLNVSFWIQGDKGSAYAVWLRAGDKRRPVGRDPIKKQWTHVELTVPLASDGQQVLEIVAPSSFGGNSPGKAWLDDLAVTIQPPLVLDWPETPQSFPALACDAQGTVWLALLERQAPKVRGRLAKVVDEQARPVQSFEPEGATGMAPPVVAGLADGCVLAFPVEQQDRWRIAYAFVTAGKNELRFVDGPGTSNISPVLAVAGTDVHLLWESNAGEARGIHACTITPQGHSVPQRLSGAAANSYNPAVVALADGRLFAAWDSLREQSADLYGAWFRDGTWEPEKRLTNNTRIERHPALAAWKDQVWLAWQAQSYRGLGLNGVNEQLLAVARLDEQGGLLAPKGLFAKVSPKGTFLMRPQLAFDADGRLWLTVRRSLHLNGGWAPEAWCYSGDQWQGPLRLHPVQGRWQPAPLTATPNGLVTATQFDDLPARWEQMGIHPDWKSGVAVSALPAAPAPAPAALVTEPLEMPEPDFALREKMDSCSALLPRQQVKLGGKVLTLFWGDLHDHTDLSVCQRRTNPPGHDLFANVRDIQRLDFVALTDHGYNFDPPQWALNGEQTRQNHDPDRFVTFLGQEWTSSKNPPAPGGKANRYGHRNLIFLDPYHPNFYDSYDGDINPRQLWDQIGNAEFITIPHQLADWKYEGRGNPPTDWSFHDDKLQPLAEVFQARQSFEYLGCPRQSPDGAPFKGSYLQDAWAQGIVIGTIASPDHGGGNGMAGVWAEDLSRPAIFRALQARHTLGTSGAKMGLFFRAGDAMMGDRVPRPDGAITFQVHALALRPIKELVIFRNNEIVHRLEPNQCALDVEWRDDAVPAADWLWYYARLHTDDDQLAWSSPIWFEAAK